MLTQTRASRHFTMRTCSVVQCVGHVHCKAVGHGERHKAERKGRCGRELANSSGCRASCSFPEPGPISSVVCAHRKRGARFVFIRRLPYLAHNDTLVATAGSRADGTYRSRDMSMYNVMFAPESMAMAFVATDVVPALSDLWIC